jgi:flagellar export protein FliJ
MKRFKFTLEAIRRIRAQEEQLVQIELATALRERAEVVAQLAASRQAEADVNEWMRTNALTGAAMAHVAQFSTLHRQRIFDTRAQLANHDARVARVREQLVVAQAKRKALDKLREKELERYGKAVRAQETRDLDEVATQRHGHGMGVSGAMAYAGGERS